MLHNLAFIVGIQCIRRLIEKQELRIFINSAGYQQALTLSLADAVSLHADLRIIPQRKRIDEVTNVGHCHRMAKALHIHLFLPHGNIICNRVREDKAILHHRTALRTPEVRIYHIQRGLTYLDIPLIRSIKAKHQLDQRSLAATARTHNRRHLVFGYVQVHIIQHIVTIRTVITEREILDTYITPFRKNRQLRGNILLFILLPMNLVQALQTDLRILQLLCKTDKRADRTA